LCVGQCLLAVEKTGNSWVQGEEEVEEVEDVKEKRGGASAARSAWQLRMSGVNGLDSVATSYGSTGLARR